MATPLAQPSRQKNAPLTETHFVEWDPAGDRRELTELAEHARMFAPIIGLENSPVPDSLMMDITGCGSLFHGESVLAERLLQKFQQLGWQCRATISDSVASAWAFAHPGGHLLQQVIGPDEMDGRFDQSWQASSIIIPPGQSPSYLGSFPVAAARISQTDIRTLSELGILTLRQLIELPIEDLPSRLSNGTIQRVRQLTEVDEELITSIPEANPVSARWVSEIPATNRNEIRQVLEHLVTELEPQLRRRGVGAIRLNVTMKYEDESTDVLSAEVVSPLQRATAMLEVLNLRIESLQLQQPVLTVSMTTTVAPLPVPRQRDLFSANEHLEPQEELTTVVNRLNNRLGSDAVLTAELGDCSIPERAVQYAPVMSSHSQAARRTAATLIQNLVDPEDHPSESALSVSRPIFLLPVPVEIGTQHPAGNFTFRWEGQTFETVTCAGPERVQTQWWHDAATHRDYYRLRTAQGAEFWVFQNLRTERWFLHGIFE